MKPIKIISATNKPRINDTLLWKTLEFYESQEFNENVTCKMYTENTESLAKVYNKEITLNNKDKIVVFVHDDAIIEDAFLYEKLNEAMLEYDVVGLAGLMAPITLKRPALWHLMGEVSQRRGAVAHFDERGSKRFMTSFGPTPERVGLLDGVFLAINTEIILEKGLKFDENNPSRFHYYDLNFSLDANKLNLKLGIWPIWLTHQSHGLEQSSEEWVLGQEYFLQKYTMPVNNSKG